MFPELEESSGKRKREEDQVFAFGWRKIMLFQPVQLLSSIVGAKRHNWKEKSVNYGSGTGNAGREEHTQILLGRSLSYDNVHLESDLYTQREGVGT